MKKIVKEQSSNIIVFLLFCAIVFISNWSILLGNNLMKYDIMDAHYPNSLFLSNCLQNGVLPLWNPQIRYGIPYYTTIGGPVWYPTTVILALFDYPLVSVGIEYSFHIVIACFGMYLLIQSLLDQSSWRYRRVIAIMAGIFYGFSGVFMSNAQHIMIIISAAWIPMVLYFVRRYVQSQKKSLLLIAGFCSGLSVLGGYPELWVAMFLVLIPYCIWQYEAILPIKKRIGKAFVLYCSIGISTVLASFVTLFPFLIGINNFDRMTRDLGMQLSSYNFELILSAFFPNVTTYIQNAAKPIDISMMSSYIGLFSILTIPVIFRKESKNRIWCLAIAAFGFLMMLGDKTFFHGLFYRFFPMFDTFRFPTLWRCIVALFLLIALSESWLHLLQDADEQRTVSRLAGKAALGLFFLAVLIGIIGQVQIPSGDKIFSEKITSDLWITCIIISAYSALFYVMARAKENNVKIHILCILAIVIFEVSFYRYEIGPVTITKKFPTDSLNSRTVSDHIESETEKNKNRVRSVDFKDAIRSRNADSISHTTPTLEGTLNEEGYTVIKRPNELQYTGSVNAFITRQNPVAYFTGNVVDNQEISLEEWLQKITADPSEIYMEESGINQGFTETVIGEAQNLTEEAVGISVDDGNYTLSGEFPNASSKKFTQLRVYVSGSVTDVVMVDISFVLEEDGSSYQEQIYYVFEDDRGKYFNVYMPDDKSYSQIVINPHDDGVGIQESYYIAGERIRKADNVKVEWFLPNDISLTVNNEDTGYLVLMQSMYPMWHMYVDGAEEEISLINGLFMGAKLEPGVHEVRFRFIPWDFYVGAVVSGGYFLMMIIMIVHEHRKKGKKNDGN